MGPQLRRDTPAGQPGRAVRRSVMRWSVMRRSADAGMTTAE